MTVVTRFAPSPTGFLHIGGARTALFNYLYARHFGGRYLIRIEDTDRQRSTEEAIAAIRDGLAWLGLEGDEPAIFQSRNATRHAEVARQLLADGQAYRCYMTTAELDAEREAARAEGRPVRIRSPWRDADPSEAPAGIDPVVRIKMPREGKTTIADKVQGDVTIDHEQLDDFILLRGDGSPTYMLSVVVDDHDMGITHVIRGDDHLTNAFRQYHLYKLCGWEPPVFAHIPLIHGPDGAKLSKRHGALGVDAYREMGYLPEAVKNYLLRLGWAHGDDEVISEAQAIDWFDLPQVGRSAARFDFAKLENLNGHYLREAEDARLTNLVVERLSRERTLDDVATTRLRDGMGGLKARANTVAQLAESAIFYIDRPVFPLENPKAAKLLSGGGAAVAREAGSALRDLDRWLEEDIEARLRRFAEEKEIGFGKVAQPLRAALTGSNASPGLFEVMAILGREETLARLARTPDHD
ncbi:glutamate--tRNA ligase [Marivibrio halodurans]|uniref:Glutamate--tRNA ligase n=1 Tax=Marivibrio halodurans TaxID=2039722 RepID=A0A8J7SKF6_9PROT|nr:glutamate--tRNA ligase [Marivibrio halodurans]MBP5855471.1 glutamate--tRNA ligase [Marivibrio halodurans]